jgi:hypothetical protein
MIQIGVNGMRGLSNERKTWTLSIFVNAYFLMRIRNPELKAFSKPFEGRPWDVRSDGAYRESRDGWKLCMRQSTLGIEAVITSPQGENWVLH